MRATVHSAVVVLPGAGVPYPFPEPDDEAEIILGEWWHADVETVERQGSMLGMAPNMSDAHTINGKPGPLFPCYQKHTYALQVRSGKTYLIRIINAAVIDELFFSIAGHAMTVVEIDVTYNKPFVTSTVQLSPGQNMNVLVRADQSPGRYFMVAKPFNNMPIPADNKTATAILQYAGVQTSVVPILPQLMPATNSTGFVAAFHDKRRSLSSPRYPADVPLAVDRHLLYTIGLNIDPCDTCLNQSRLAASLNNITFDTNLLSVESHPFHLHGYNFFVVGRGVRNFDPAKDPAKYNLVDPPERNTVGVPAGGWAAIRFRANNPGVWFLHCHLEVHTSWDLKTAFLLEDGSGPDESVLPPPKDLPKC
uniref:laccase n=1 Tax=Oryza brachyantha TaxID=4533 RepID=J3L263_ORYBR